MKKRNFLTTFSSALILMNFISCAPKLHSKKKSELKLGYIVQASLSEVTALSKIKDVTVRTISEKAQIFEIRGMEKKDIEKKLGHLEGFQIEKNIMVYNSFPTKSRLDNIETEIPGFKKNCANDPLLEEEPAKLAPKALISLAGNGAVFTNDNLNKLVTTLNAEIKLTGANSTVDATVGGKLRYSWIVEPPLYSNYDVTKVVTDKEFSLKTDSLGGYNITLIVQGKNKVCNATSFTFGVTANFPYKKVEGTPPSDPAYYEQFGYMKTMGITDSWKSGSGEGVKVAVLDTGINYLHPYLSSNVAINTNEIPDNNIDDDKNGFVDDVIGWDFINNDNMPFDDNGHGSHVSGLIASTAFGVAPKAKILPVKVFNAEGFCTLGDIIMGFLYSIDQGATVINFSAGNEFLRWKMLSGVLQYAKIRNVTIIAAAGNNLKNVDLTPYYPANLNLENIINVAASNNLNQLSSYSNFGRTSVDFTAPGGDEATGELILSTAMWNGNGVELTSLQGTSMSAPLVTGTVAAMISIDSTLAFRNADLKNMLAETLTPEDSLSNKVKNAGVIHAGRATNLVKEKKLNK